MKDRKLILVDVQSFEKRKEPNKHYVYVIKIEWEDGNAATIFRRYSQFFAFHNQLIDTFVREAGLFDPKERILPFLPGKILFRRSSVRNVAEQRIKPINSYCKNLILLPKRISQCNSVLKFFEPTTEDVAAFTKHAQSSLQAHSITDPIQLEVLDTYVVRADYSKTDSNEMSVPAGHLVRVMERELTGWWFVLGQNGEQGWVPSVILQRKDGAADDRVAYSCKPGQVGMPYICHRDYEARQADELSISKGSVLEIIEKHLDGWWLARLPKRAEGRVPATHISSADSTKIQRHDKSDPPIRRNMVRPPRPMAPPRLLLYKATRDYDAEIDGTLPIAVNQTVRVISRTQEHWWLVKNDLGQEGWAPASLLVRTACKKLGRSDSAPPQALRSQWSTETKEKPQRPQTPVKVAVAQPKPQLAVKPTKPNESPRPTIKPLLPPKPMLSLQRQSPTGSVDDVNAADFSSFDESSRSATPSPKRSFRELLEKKLAATNLSLGVKSMNLWEAIENYDAVEESEIGMKAGQRFQVMDEKLGWSLIQEGDKQGWVPTSYLIRA